MFQKTKVNVKEAEDGQFFKVNESIDITSSYLSIFYATINVLHTFVFNFRWQFIGDDLLWHSQEALPLLRYNLNGRIA